MKIVAMEARFVEVGALVASPTGPKPVTKREHRGSGRYLFTYGSVSTRFGRLPGETVFVFVEDDSDPALAGFSTEDLLAVVIELTHVVHSTTSEENRAISRARRDAARAEILRRADR